MDQLLVLGLYQMRPPTPFVPGTEAAGIVSAVGERVEKFAPGDRVACGSWTGGYAERMIAKESKSVRLPDGVAFESRGYGHSHNYSARPTTRWSSGRERNAARPTFVTGAAGGVGLAAVDLGRHLGLRVVAGVGSDDKAALVRAVTGLATSSTIGARICASGSSRSPAEKASMSAFFFFFFFFFSTMSAVRFSSRWRGMMNWGGRLMPIGFTSGQISVAPDEPPAAEELVPLIGVFAGAWAEKFPQRLRA